MVLEIMHMLGVALKKEPRGVALLDAINEYFDLKFAVYLAIAFYYDVLKGLF